MPLPPALDAVVLRCLEKRPDQRYDSVTDFLSALEEAVDGGGAWRRRDGEPDPPTRGVAVYAQVRMDAEWDLDDALADDLNRLLDMVEEALSSAGFLLATMTSSDVLGVRLLSVDPREETRERAAALDTAASLLGRVEGRPGADGRIRINVCVHVAEVVTRRTSRLEVVGGDLLRTDRWAPRDDSVGVCATPEAVEDLTGRGSAEAQGPQGPFRVVGGLPSDSSRPAGYVPDQDIGWGQRWS
jgi:serine/threonine-protein kinase